MTVSKSKIFFASHVMKRPNVSKSPENFWDVIKQNVIKKSNQHSILLARAVHHDELVRGKTISHDANQ